MPNEDVVITVEFEKIPENPNTGLSNPLIVFSGILAIALVGSLVVKKKKFI
jgi:LPXTG-motif cell wall-anchored protein